MLMMERINHALGDGIGDRDESEENDMSSTFSFTRPQHEGQDIRCFQDTSMGLVGALQFGIHRSVMGTNVRDTNRTVAEIGSMDMSGQRISNSVEVLNMMRGLPGNPRPFSMPDLYSRSPMVSMRTINTSALTNTSPMQYPMDRATPSSSTGMRGLEDSVTDFPTKPGIQELDKSNRKTFELDLNLPFPVKLHYILSNAKYQDCIAWLPHGRAWRVLKPKAFERRVIPKFFRSAKYASFMRQVMLAEGSFVVVQQGSTDMSLCCDCR